ncbi:hypothetical protein LXL04_038580 [Taraxacum kok-saghyz]
MDPHSFIARAEAQRWLGIAEKLLMGHDLVGSKTFAIRARDSDPRLEAAEQILAIADTLLAAEKRVVGNNGTQQPDYYAILQLVRFVQDTDQIASQFRRLAVMLNPHQNRFPYSDQAFQLVNDAWAVLSNPMRKSMYDSDLDFPPQQQMNTIGFNLEQQHHHQQHHHQQQQQQQHNFFSINHMGSSHEQELPEPQQTFQTRVQQSHQQQQLQQHNFLSQPSPVRQEQLFQHREQEHLFQPQAQPFQVSSPPHQQTRQPPQPPPPQVQPFQVTSPPHQQSRQSIQPPKREQEQLFHHQPPPKREQEQLFHHQPPPKREQEQLFHHREQEQLFQPQAQPFQVTSPPHQQARQPPSQPPPPQVQPFQVTSPPHQQTRQPQQPSPAQVQPFQITSPPHHQTRQPQQPPPQPQVQPFQVTSPPHQQTRQPSQPPQPQQRIQSPSPPPPPAVTQQPPFSWTQAPPQQQPPPSQPQPQPTPPQSRPMPMPMPKPQPQPQAQPQPPQPQPQSQPQPTPPQSRPQPQSQPQSQPPPPQSRSQPPPEPQLQEQQQQHHHLHPQPQQQIHQMQEQPQPPPSPPPPPLPQSQPQQQEQESPEHNASPTDLPPHVNNDNGVIDEDIEIETEEEPAEIIDDSPTFWTSCPFCFYMYEYPRVYAECTLRCDNCQRAFQAVRIPSPPQIAEGQDAYFCCWGYFPLGVSMSHLDKDNTQGTKKPWTPFSPMFNPSSGNIKNQNQNQNQNQNHLNGKAAPKENTFVNKSSGPRIPFNDDDISDDVFMEVSDSDSDSDFDSSNEWGNTKRKKTKKVPFKNRPQVLAIGARDVKSGGTFKKLGNGMKESGNGNGNRIPRRQSGRVGKELGRLDLNVEFNNNEGHGHGNGEGEGEGDDDNVEGNGFFEGLDEFLSSLPILSVVNEEKVKA